MTKPLAIIREKAYFPVSCVDTSLIESVYKRRMYSENTCRTCNNRSERHNYLCDTCPRDAYQGILNFTDYKVFKGVQYIGLPLGDKINYAKKVGIFLADYTYRDLRKVIPFNVNLAFTGTLRDYQLPIVNDFLQHKYGLIQAPPRTGKTIISLYLALKLGQKTLILADQYEFLEQFQEHVRKFTNIAALEARAQRPLIGFPKKEDDFKNLQICFCTYQRFISEKGQRLLAKVAPYFSTVITDEVHKAAANCFSSVVAKLYPRYLFGVTATVERKDGRHFIIKHLIGPIVAESKRESLPVKIYVKPTPVKFREYKLWIYFLRYLANCEERNNLIVRDIVRDVRKGHSIVVPVFFKNHVFTLVKMINDAYGSKIAEAFVGGTGNQNKQQRLDVLENARRRKTLVVVGIRRLLQLGLDIVPWSCLYEITPISNKPNLKQETSRIRTSDPTGKKRNPIIRFYVDVAMPQSLGCFRSSVGHFRSFAGYSFSKKAKELIARLGGHKKRTPFSRQEGLFTLPSPVVDEAADYGLNVRTRTKKPARFTQLARKM